MPPADDDSRGETRPGWTFLTNHGHVLVCVANDPSVRGRDIAQQVGITERGAQAIIADLVEAGYLERTRIGRRNHYRIRLDQPLRHPLEQSHQIGELLKLVGGTPRVEASGSEGSGHGADAGGKGSDVRSRPSRVS